MSAKVQQLHQVEPEVPGLRAAFAAEKQALDRLSDVKAKSLQAQGAVALRQKDRAALAGRLARGENVTGGDLRSANDAVLDAEGLVLLLAEAVPEAEAALRLATRTRSGITVKLWESKRSAARDELEDAEAAVQAALQRRVVAQAAVQHLPPAVIEELEDLFDDHGRDAATSRAIAEMERQAEIARLRLAQAGR